MDEEKIKELERRIANLEAGLDIAFRMLRMQMNWNTCQIKINQEIQRVFLGGK